MASRHAAEPPPDDLSGIELERLWDLRDLKHNELFLMRHSQFVESLKRANKHISELKATSRELGNQEMSHLAQRLASNYDDLRKTPAVDLAQSRWASKRVTRGMGSCHRAAMKSICGSGQHNQDSQSREGTTTTEDQQTLAAGLIDKTGDVVRDTFICGRVLPLLANYSKDSAQDEIRSLLNEYTIAATPSTDTTNDRQSRRLPGLGHLWYRAKPRSVGMEWMTRQQQRSDVASLFKRLKTSQEGSLPASLPAGDFDTALLLSKAMAMYKMENPSSYQALKDATLSCTESLIPCSMSPDRRKPRRASRCSTPASRTEKRLGYSIRDYMDDVRVDRWSDRLPAPFYSPPPGTIVSQDPGSSRLGAARYPLEIMSHGAQPDLGSHAVSAHRPQSHYSASTPGSERLELLNQTGRALNRLIKNHDPDEATRHLTDMISRHSRTFSDDIGLSLRPPQPTDSSHATQSLIKLCHRAVPLLTSKLDDSQAGQNLKNATHWPVTHETLETEDQASLKESARFMCNGIREYVEERKLGRRASCSNLPSHMPSSSGIMSRS